MAVLSAPSVTDCPPQPLDGGHPSEPGLSQLGVGYLIGRADRLVSADLETALAGSGLSLAQFTALSVFAASPGLSNAELARRSQVTPQAIHRAVKALEEAGFVERTASAQGGRMVETRLTNAGAEILDQLEPQLAIAHDRSFALLAPAERVELARLLAKATGVG